jgi:hypothetical protein
MNRIKEIDFSVRDAEKLASALISLFNVCREELKKPLQNKLIEDFGTFLSQGKWTIHNTYNGGLLFLREPERVSELRLEFSSQEKTAQVVVEFDSSTRNQRNTKYKPDAGKTESVEWKLSWLFPHFHFYPIEVQRFLIMALAKIGKEICEKENKDSWHMIYTHDFEIKAILDGEVIDTLEVLYLRDENSPKRTD